MNPLRHEFTQNTANILEPEYGTIQDSLEFHYLYEMDLYHHVSNGAMYSEFYLRQVSMMHGYRLGFLAK
uniref:Uncharacterized protein n=1 Tax=Roseihalotalea indica TaxID=2867963 RepID=A0AA49GSB8_9BACT|nr:hypothetical protein K4G66_08005 [Tunicatimonas sp. TK19036]